MLNEESIRAFAAANGLRNVEVLTFIRVHSTPDHDTEYQSWVALVLAQDAQQLQGFHPWTVRGAMVKGGPDADLMVHDPAVSMWKSADHLHRDDMVVTAGKAAFYDTYQQVLEDL